MENQFNNRIEQRIAQFCTSSSFDDEQVIVGEMPSHSIALAWQVDCSKFGPKLESGHLNYRVHFGEDK